jgi:hypothetical protein
MGWGGMVVYAFLRGESAEGIAVAFYMANREAVGLRFTGSWPSTPEYACTAGMRPRFLADADFNHKIVVGLRRRELSVDFLTPR